VLAPLLLVSAVLACFLPALQGAFLVWDDDLNFTDNPSYRGLGPSQLWWMFTSFHEGHYQPLSWVTLGVDYLLWGMNPTGYHLTNVLLHAANAVACWALVTALLRRALPQPVPAALAPAALVGALGFAIHPLRVESVAWVSERRDVLSGLFYLLTLLAYLRAAAEPAAGRLRWLALSVGAFTLSLLSKAWGITLPAVLVAFDVYPLRRFGRERTAGVLVEKLPFVALAGAGAVLATLAQRVEAMKTLGEHGPTARIAQAAYGICFYPWKTLLPVGLSPLYLLEQPLDPTRPRYVVAILVVLGVTLALLAMRRRWPWALLAWVCYVATVSPVLGLLQSGSQLVADRYSYLACLPFPVLAAALVHELAARGEAARRATLAVAGLALAALGALTFQQSRVWKDSRTLWDHVLRLDPTNYVAYLNRGLAKQYDGDLAGARADYDAALRANPGHIQAYNNRGIVRFATGDVDGAIADYTAALRFRPGYADALANRAIAREAKQDVDGAIADYTAALAANPGHAKAAYGRGNLRFARGDLDGAFADYSTAIRINPAYVEAYNNRALVRRRRGDLAGAIADYTRGVAAAPPGWPGRETIERNLAAARSSAGH
jgi:tetratricopeptide (TPR) repeat protein